MEPDLSTPVSALRSQLTRVKNAWAQWRDATSQCAFAAVMGSAVPAAMRPSAEWSLDQSLCEDPQYDDSMRSIRMQARRPDCDRLHQAVLAHLRWVTTESENHVVAEVESIASGMDAWIARQGSDHNGRLAAAEAALEEASKTACTLQRLFLLKSTMVNSDYLCVTNCRPLECRSAHLNV